MTDPGRLHPDAANPPLILFAGRATLDVIYSLDHFPSEDTKSFARAMHVAPGGPATNAAITHTLLGGRSVLMTALGGGPWAAAVRDDLQRLGIDLIDLAANTPHYQTPVTTVIVNEAQATRTIVNPPQPRLELSRPEVWNPEWGDAPALVLTDGFLLDEVLPLLRSFRAAGALIVLDGGSWKKGTEELASLLSVAICSERFALPGAPSDPHATIGWFAEKGVPHIAVTRGEKSILGSDRGRRFEIPIATIDAVDTTGAGDVLHGAFCYWFSRDGDFEQALRLAADIATRSCEDLGIRRWRKDL